jgi:hypothetical protein
MKAKHKTALNGFSGNLICHPYSVRYLAGNKVWLHLTIDNQAPTNQSEYLPFQDLITVIDAGDSDWDSALQVLLNYDNGDLKGAEVLL